VVISASYRTDIPGFYSRWFERRYDAGYCLVPNPFDSGLRRVELRGEEVQAYVFWTRNIAPFVPQLRQFGRDRMPFVVQYTVTGYPRALETAAASESRALALIEELSSLFGPDSVVWRYDPVVLTSLTDRDWHRAQFSRLAERMRYAVNEVIVSFATMYRKTTTNLRRAGERHDFSFEDPDDHDKRRLLLELASIAGEHDLKLSVCSQRHLLAPGLCDAACVDPERLARVAGHPLRVARKAHRKDCGCYESVDIGVYDTCPTGCVYCYANRNRDMAERRRREHRPDDLMLWRPARLTAFSGPQLEALAEGREDPHKDQLLLFDDLD